MRHIQNELVLHLVNFYITGDIMENRHRTQVETFMINRSDSHVEYQATHRDTVCRDTTLALIGGGIQNSRHPRGGIFVNFNHFF